MDQFTSQPYEGNVALCDDSRLITRLFFGQIAAIKMWGFLILRRQKIRFRGLMLSDNERTIKEGCYLAELFKGMFLNIV